MSFVSNGGKFKLYTVLNGLIFPTPTQSRISFERAIIINSIKNLKIHAFSSERFCKYKEQLPVTLFSIKLKN
jgi:hypothetical protein